MLNAVGLSLLDARVARRDKRRQLVFKRPSEYAMPSSEIRPPAATEPPNLAVA